MYFVMYTPFLTFYIHVDQSGQKKERNKHTLKPPFDDAEVYGDIVLTRSGKDGEPKDFTLNEYNSYTGEDDYVDEDDDEDEEEEMGDEDDEEDEDEDDYGEDDDEDDDAFLERLSQEITQEFMAAQGREPTESEMMALLVVRANQPQDDEEEEIDTPAPKAREKKGKAKK